MKALDFIKRLEQDYPLKYALEWDNVGLLLGRRNKDIKRVYIALDVTGEVIQKAIEKGADMLLTHHPMIMEPIRRITGGCPLTHNIITLLQHDMLCYAMHTNYDALRMCKLASEMIGIKKSKVLEPLEGTMENIGIGEIGTIEKAISLKECAELVKNRFALTQVKIFGDLASEVQKVAIVPGGGKSTIATAIEKGADVLITGDIGHHDGLDSLAGQMAIIDAGHYGTEYIFIKDMKEYLQKNFSEIEIMSHPIEQPFCII